MSCPLSTPRGADASENFHVPLDGPSRSSAYAVLRGRQRLAGLGEREGNTRPSPVGHGLAQKTRQRPQQANGGGSGGSSTGGSRPGTGLAGRRASAGDSKGGEGDVFPSRRNPWQLVWSPVKSSRRGGLGKRNRSLSSVGKDDTAAAGSRVPLIRRQSMAGTGPEKVRNGRTLHRGVSRNPT